MYISNASDPWRNEKNEAICATTFCVTYQISSWSSRVKWLGGVGFWIDVCIVRKILEKWLTKLSRLSRSKSFSCLMTSQATVPLMKSYSIFRCSLVAYFSSVAFGVIFFVGIRVVSGAYRLNIVYFPATRLNFYHWLLLSLLLMWASSFQIISALGWNLKLDTQSEACDYHVLSWTQKHLTTSYDYDVLFQIPSNWIWRMYVVKQDTLTFVPSFKNVNLTFNGAWVMIAKHPMGCCCTKLYGICCKQNKEENNKYYF